MGLLCPDLLPKVEQCQKHQNGYPQCSFKNVGEFGTLDDLSTLYIEVDLERNHLSYQSKQKGSIPSLL